MSNYEKDDFVGIWNVTAGARQLLHDAANNRGQQCFNALAQFGNTTSAPPLSWAAQVQQYTIPDVAGVDDFLNYPGVAIRGAEFLNQLATLGVPGAVAVVEAGPATSVSFTVAGVFEIGDRIEVDMTAGLAPIVHLESYIAVTPSGPVAMAEGIGTQCALVEDITYETSQPGGIGTPVTVTLTSANPITLNSVTIVLAVADPALLNSLPNVYTAQGTWEGGTTITFNLVITDPDGQVDNVTVPITLPPGQHTGEVVAAVVAGELDPQPHIRAVAAGNTLTLSAADDDYSLDSSASVS